MASIHNESTYTLTASGKRYAPRANTQYGHHTNWEAIQKAIANSKGKGVTGAALMALKDKLPEQVQANHAPYLGYAVRRGWLQAKA